MFVFPLNVALILVSCFGFIYLCIQYHYGYWKRKNIFCPPTKFLLGNLTLNTALGITSTRLYEKYKNYPFIGIFFYLRKTLVVHDLDLVKNVLLKDYSFFQGHGVKFNEQDPLAHHLFNMEGDEWKKLRVKLTPTFTSSKMKYMFDTMLSCAEEMTIHIEDLVEKEESIEVKEILARFGTDVIASCAFGLQSNSFKYPDADFRRMGKKILTTTIRTKIMLSLATIAPSFMQKLKITRFEPDLSDFFRNTVKETIEYRETNNIKRNDFLQLLIDMKNDDQESENYFSLAEITPQVFVFFLAGFETSSTTSTFALLELCKNPDIKNDLVAKIDEVMDECDGKITYEILSRMNILNQVVEETLRMYPPLPMLLRTCTTDYKVPNTDTIIEKGTLVMIPTLGIHRDPKIYPNPLQFDPERFSPKNVQERHHFSHIPFGEGPRICIGSRFGMMQVKLALLTILRNFEVELSDETILPIKFEPKIFILQIEGGLHLRISKRNLKSKTS